MRPTIVLSLLALTIAMAAPVGAADTRAQQQLYFDCAESRLANQDGAEFGWSSTPPAGSLADGEGCGFLGVRGDPTLGQDAIGPVPVTPSFRGTIDGEIDSLTVRLWNADASYSRQPVFSTPGMSVFVWLTIDGVPSLDRREVILTSPRFHDAVRNFAFTISDLGFTGEAQEKAHEVELRIAIGSRTESSLWLFGASEAPSRLDVNPANSQPHKVEPDRTPVGAGTNR